jgi:hypothetical protein
MTGPIHELPVGLAVVGTVAGLVGAGLLVLLLWHAFRRVVDSPRIPLSKATYGALSVVCLVLLGVGLVRLGIGRLLRDHARLDGAGGKTRVAEVRCTPVAAGKVRITFAPIGAGTAKPEQFESNGPGCRVSAELVTMRALPARLGVATLVRVTQVGEEARPPENPDWLVPPANTVPGFPLALVVRGARSTSVSATPDARAVSHLVASPAGLELEKSGGG